MRKSLLFTLALLISAGLAIAQDRSVSGTVTSVDDGSPIPGANVLVKGTTNGTVTDIEGNYKLTVPSDATTLVFSFIGYGSTEIEIGTRAVIDVALETDITELSEVVVTAFGVEKESKSLGYAVQEVQAEEITKTRQASALSSLQGKVAGATISNAGGAIGASTRVVLRGPTSLLGNNQALFVVDGIPIDNSTASNVQSSGNFYDNVVDGGNRANDIDPENIESITILKGPSAAALYGSRAANGVILITTKKGRDMSGQDKKTEITLNSSFQLSEVYVIPKMQNQFGQGQFGDNQAFLNDQESWGDPFDGTLRPYGAVVNNLQQYKPYVGLEDNLKDFYEIGKTFQNSLSLSGGSEKTTYYLSLTDLNQTGVLPNTEYRRNNFTLNGSTKLSNKVTSSASINYVRVEALLPQTGQRNQAIGQIVSMPRDYSIVDLKDLNNPYNTPDGYFTPFIVNPYYTLEKDFSQQSMNRVYGNFQISYKPMDWLTATAKVGSDLVSDQRNTLADIVVYNDPNGPNFGAAFNVDGEYTEQRINSRQIDANFILQATRNITEDIEGTLLVGYNYNQRSADNLSSTAAALTLPEFPNLSNASGIVTSSGTSSKRRLMGLYTSLDMSYKGFLFVGATFRNDWSSTLPLENNSFSYPSVNLGFVVTDAFELGIDNVLSFAKIRASWAQVGNDAGVYLTNSTFGQSGFAAGFAQINFPFNDGSAGAPYPGFSESNRIGNPTLQPEITTATELGLDLRFFKGRLNIDASYYDSKSESQILNASIAPSTGFTSQVLNVGTITNKGIELQVGGTPIKIGDFSWDISVNFAKNNNLVTELNDGNTQLTIVAQNLTPGLLLVVGKPYGVFEATQVLRNGDGKIVVDANGLPVDDPEPVQIGSIQADWSGGLVSSFNYKGIKLSVTLDTRQGGNVVSSTAAQLYFAGIAEETAFNDREDYIIPNSVIDNGDGTYRPNNIPLTNSNNNIRQIWADVQGGNRNEEVLLDASYIKLRELSLSYDLPSSLLDRTPLGKVSLSVFGRNLWLHTYGNNHFIDPEASAFGNGNRQGYEFIGIPTQATYGVNLRVTF